MLSILLQKYSVLVLLEDPGDSTGTSTLVLLEARWRGGGGGAGAVEARLLIESMLRTDAGRLECRFDGIRAGGGAGAGIDVDLSCS